MTCTHFPFSRKKIKWLSPVPFPLNPLPYGVSIITANRCCYVRLTAIQRTRTSSPPYHVSHVGVRPHKSYRLSRSSSLAGTLFNYGIARGLVLYNLRRKLLTKSVLLINDVSICMSSAHSSKFPPLTAGV